MTISISSDRSRKCPLCPEWQNGIDDFEASCNHVLEKHEGFKLLHVGTQTTRSYKGEAWHSTVAVFEGAWPDKLEITPEQIRLAAKTIAEMPQLESEQPS